MDVNVYNLARTMITERDWRAETIARLEQPAMHEDYTTDTGHCSPGCPACKLLGWQ
jgi:hypothetical protein